MSLFEWLLPAVVVALAEWTISRKPLWLARMPGFAIATRTVASERVLPELVRSLTRGGPYRGTLATTPELSRWPRAGGVSVPGTVVHRVPYGLVVHPSEAVVLRGFGQSVVHVDATWEKNALVLRTRWVPWPLVTNLALPVWTALALSATSSTPPTWVVWTVTALALVWATGSFAQYRGVGLSVSEQALDAYEGNVTGTSDLIQP